ncbi:cysteine hydrolase family protein [Lysinibacillus xylanilyticus]|uniref:cysteine hydrolase family protein n=1 Tax=Lysinibacillus xylanilyticus TaxID=582475 RepID=UPI0012FD4A5A|nr:isochorismatase family cysteine hydrolase [Lysinibacillus xylanilyticus]
MKQALLVLDIQNDYLSTQARMPVAKHQIESTLNCINDLIKRAEKSNVPILYIKNEFERMQLFTNFLRKFTALKGSKGAELDERLLIRDGPNFSKNEADAFSNPSLITYLNNNGINDLIVTGIFIEGCVTATVEGALARDFAVTVVEDAVAGATDLSKEAAFIKLATQDILILSSEQIFESDNDQGEV